MSRGGSAHDITRRRASIRRTNAELLVAVAAIAPPGACRSNTSVGWYLSRILIARAVPRPPRSHRRRARRDHDSDGARPHARLFRNTGAEPDESRASVGATV